MLVYDFGYLKLLEPERLVDLHPFLLWTVWKVFFSFHDPAAFAQLTVEARIWRYHLVILVTWFLWWSFHRHFLKVIYMFANSGDNGDLIANHSSCWIEIRICCMHTECIYQVPYISEKGPNPKLYLSVDRALSLVPWWISSQYLSSPPGWYDWKHLIDISKWIEISCVGYITWVDISLKTPEF